MFVMRLDCVVREGRHVVCYYPLATLPIHDAIPFCHSPRSPMENWSSALNFDWRGCERRGQRAHFRSVCRVDLPSTLSFHHHLLSPPPSSLHPIIAYTTHTLCIHSLPLRCSFPFPSSCSFPSFLIIMSDDRGGRGASEGQQQHHHNTGDGNDIVSTIQLDYALMHNACVLRLMSPPP